MQVVADEKDGSQAGGRITSTFGEVFEDGSILDLVESSHSGHLNLLLWNGTTSRIARQVEHGGFIYESESLDQSVLRATRFPLAPLSYGTTRELFSELTIVLEKCMAFPEATAERVAFWVLTTHFCDLLWSPPILWVAGANIDLAARFFALAHCLCRRAMRVNGLTRSGFFSLPTALRPTLLVNQPSSSRALHSLWCESNFRGSVIPVKGGAVADASGSKAIYVGTEGSAPAPSAGSLDLRLLPPDREVPTLDEQKRNAIADYFLPRLLQYRLDHALRVRESKFRAPGLRLPTRELAHNLGACIQGDADLALRIGPLLLQEEEMVLRCDLDHAILEVLWPRLHRNAARTEVLSMKIDAELTADVNTFLLSCGETRQYSREEVGLRVAKLHLSRKRTSAGTVLLMDRATSRRVHDLVRAYGIDKSGFGCPDCQPVQDSAE